MSITYFYRGFSFGKYCFICLDTTDGLCGETWKLVIHGTKLPKTRHVRNRGLSFKGLLPLVLILLFFFRFWKRSALRKTIFTISSSLSWHMLAGWYRHGRCFVTWGNNFFASRLAPQVSYLEKSPVGRSRSIISWDAVSLLVWIAVWPNPSMLVIPPHSFLLWCHLQPVFKTSRGTAPLIELLMS